MAFYIIIPARYASTRFPGKPLIDIRGKSMIQRVYEQAAKSHAKQVFVATDDERIADAVNHFGGEVVITSPEHPSGTDRVHEAAMHLGLADEDTLVNLQADEPLMPPSIINQVAAYLADPGINLATLKAPITEQADIHDPHVVKVVTDAQGWALYFSRAPLPYLRQAQPGQKGPDLSGNSRWFQHLGIYAYRLSLLKEFVTWARSDLEKTEQLEQLRALDQGASIFVGLTERTLPPSIDVPEDLAKTLAYLDAEDSAAMTY